MRVRCFFFSVLISCSANYAQQPNPRVKIGVALQGGGAKGLAHIGVLQSLEEHHIPIDHLAGTSPAEIQRIVKEVDWDSVLSGAIPYEALAFRRKQDLRAFPNSLELGLKNGVQPPGGLNSRQAVRFIIDRNVLSYSDGRSFDKLPVPSAVLQLTWYRANPSYFETARSPMPSEPRCRYREFSRPSNKTGKS